MAYADININKASLSLILQIYVFTKKNIPLKINLTTWSSYSYSTTEGVKAKTGVITLFFKKHHNKHE